MDLEDLEIEARLRPIRAKRAESGMIGWANTRSNVALSREREFYK